MALKKDRARNARTGDASCFSYEAGASMNCRNIEFPSVVMPAPRSSAMERHFETGEHIASLLLNVSRTAWLPLRGSGDGMNIGRV